MKLPFNTLKATLAALLVMMVFAVPALGQSSEDEDLMVNDWQWVSFTSPVEQFDVEMPESYKLRFLDDGTISVTADCNSAFLPFTDEEGSLTIETGVMTLALCPDDSRSEQFVGLLGGAARYFFEDGNLFIDLVADGGTLELAPVVPLTLTSNSWQWLRFTGNFGVYDIEMPINYLLTFNDDGTVNIVADCNNAMGDYVDENGDLTIEIGPATLALCPGDSQGEDFVRLLGGAQRYSIDRENLFIVVEEDGGTMSFGAANPELMANDGEEAMAGAPLPPAEIANDEGGPVLVNTEFPYTSYVVARYLNSPILGLVDASNVLVGDFTEFVPPENQILGRLTSPISPSPITFQVRLPIVPPGNRVDVDNDGEQDVGLQVFSALIGPNFYGSFTFDPVEEEWFQSYLLDPQDGTVREGYFLLYAPDDQQGFPASAGEDAVYFTADDPIVGLPAGYTIAQLGQDGTVTFDRSRAGTMNILEAASEASPDFSEQGILESYNSLIDLLTIRYSYTELRGLDWEEIRTTYLPQVEAADEADDMFAYYATLTEMAYSIRDAHVQVTGSAYSGAYAAQLVEAMAANLGAQLVELDDGRFIITFLDPEGPGAQGGWEFGTEILSVDGVPTAEYVASRPINAAVGTEETERLVRLRNALKYPEGVTTTIEYRQPGEDEVRSATLTPTVGTATELPRTFNTQEISFDELEGGVVYIQWNAFTNLAYKVAVLEQALTRFNAAPGVILDLRGNGGGNIGLYYTMASYFFTPEDPVTWGWIDEYVYDDAMGDLVKSFTPDYTLSSPSPEATYVGPVVVLVDEHSASAGEYFPQFLQTMGRAVLVGEHSTQGAGGPIERVAMPGGITFQFTKGRTYFAGTDELNLEAKGITLDVDVPTTEENELAKLDGVDVVLAAGLEAVAEEGQRLIGERLPGTSWQLFESVSVTGPGVSTPEDPAAYTFTFENERELTIQADCNRANAEYTIGRGGAMTITVGPTTLAACPQGSFSESFLAAFSMVSSIEIATEGIILTGINEDGLPVVLLFTPADSATEATSAVEMEDTPTADILPTDLMAQLDAWLESQVYTEGGNPSNASPGLVLLVDTPEGRYLKATGVSSLEDGTPMQVDDILEIGSNTKSFYETGWRLFAGIRATPLQPAE